MTGVRHSRAAWILRAVTVPLALLGCASATPFDRALDAQHWSEAAARFDADTVLHDDERALFRAAMLYGVPGRETYDPTRAQVLFERLLRLYPTTPKRRPAIDHLAFLYEIQRVQTAGAMRERSLQDEIAQLATDTVRLHARVDSLTVRLQAERDQSTLLHKVTTLLETDLRQRDNQLRQLDAELAELKAIDLRSLHSREGDTLHRKQPAP